MNNRQYQISALSYSNTFPFVYGLKQKLENEMFVMDFEVPAATSERFRNGEVDMALVPVGALPSMPSHKIITNFCIGAKGYVKTVCLYSNVPINEISTIYLDVESRTSMRLVQVLAKHFWNIEPVFKPYQQNINLEFSESVLLIGDKTFGKSADYKYTYDLAQEWFNFTNRPFVFAVWIGKTDLPDEVINKLNEAILFGLQNVSQLKHAFKLPISSADYEDYILNFIDYNLDNQKIDAMNLFLNYVREMNI